MNLHDRPEASSVAVPHASGDQSAGSRSHLVLFSPNPRGGAEVVMMLTSRPEHVDRSRPSREK